VIGDFGNRTQVFKCIGEDKVLLDVQYMCNAQIKRSKNWIAYEYVDAEDIIVLDLKDTYLTNVNDYDIVRVVDLRNEEQSYEILAYGNVSITRDTTQEDLLGYSSNKDNLSLDYAYNNKNEVYIMKLKPLLNDNNELVLYEVWKSHNVIFDLNGGNLKEGDQLDGSTSVVTGEKINLPTIEPFKENYVFDGWSIEKNDIYGKTGTIYYGEYENKDDLTIYAVWIPMWLANATDTTEGSTHTYTATIIGQEELDEFIRINPYIKQMNKEGQVANYVFNVKNKDGATENLKINTDIDLGSRTTLNFEDNVIINAHITIRNAMKVNKVTIEGSRNKIGFIGTGSIELKGCREFYVGNTMYLGTNKNAGIYGGNIVLTKEQETDELVLELKSGTAVLKNYDFGAVGLDFGFTIDYKFIIDEDATLEISKSAKVTGEIQNNGTIKIDKNYNLTIAEDGKYIDNGKGVITGEENFIK